MRPKLSINLQYKDKEAFLNLANLVVNAEPLKTGRTYFYKIPEGDFNSSSMEIINTLLLGLAKNVVSDKGTHALLKDAYYAEGQDREIWVNPKALETVERYLERKNK